MANTIQLNNDGSIGQDITDLGNVFISTTINNGAITYSGTLTTVDTQGNTTSDHLTLIANGGVGKLLILKNANVSRTVILKHEASGGNIYNPSGADLELSNPNQLALLLYNGTRWVVLTCCGGSYAPITPLDPEDFDDPVCCVAATRVMAFINEVVDVVKANITFSALSIAGQISPLFATVGVGSEKSAAIITLANSFKAAYSTSSAIDDDFDGAVYQTLLGAIYCNDSGCDGMYSTSEISALSLQISLESGAAFPFLVQIIQILGAAGMNNTVGAMGHITTGDCAEFEDCQSESACVDGCCFILGGYGLQGSNYLTLTHPGTTENPVYDPINDTITVQTSAGGTGLSIMLEMMNLTPGWTSIVVEYDRAVTRVAASATPTNTGVATRISPSGGWTHRQTFPIGGTIASPISATWSGTFPSGGGSYFCVRIAAGNLAANSALVRFKKVTICYD